jgi:hypothetical protein
LRYSAPPNPRIRSGRAALYEFFGGATGRPRPMRMEWHHLVFDEASQVGVGEYTFEYEIVRRQPLLTLRWCSEQCSEHATSTWRRRG